MNWKSILTCVWLHDLKQYWRRVERSNLWNILCEIVYRYTTIETLLFWVSSRKAHFICQNAIWRKSDLSFGPLYWVVALCEIWGNAIAGPIRLTYVPINENDDCETKKVLLNCSDVRAIWFAENDHNRIYHIIVYSWYKVTRMWPIMEVPQIPPPLQIKRGSTERSDFNNIVKNDCLIMFHVDPQRLRHNLPPLLLSSW